MRNLFSFLLLSLTAVWASYVQSDLWSEGQSFLNYLKRHHMPLSLYWNLDKEDKELCEEIRAGVTYYTMRDDDNTTIEQVLIPINEELQIHLAKEEKGYRFELIPVIYRKITDIFSIAIKHSPYQDIIASTNNAKLAHAFVDAFKNSFDFTRLRKGDNLAVIYEEKLRLGRPYGIPRIKAAMVEQRKRPHFLFRYNDRYYDEKGREIEGFLFRKPVSHVRITSRFTLRRWHPILHRYRAHLGVDFGGRRGTPIYAAADGRVIFAGRLGGYGNVLKIRHRDGFMTLYAHLSKFRRGMRRGRYVKKGQVIAYMGSTGMSTGPHLHFGLYKNGRPINPLGIIKVAKRTLYGKRRKAFMRYAKQMKEKLLVAAKEGKSPCKLDDLSKTHFCINQKGALKR